jgi:diguanylate cyclase (GGDEF)-like protein/PAS domain S-box-containing protein
MFEPSKVRVGLGWARPRNFAIALVLILIASALVLLNLQRYSESQYSLALRTDELGLAAYDLSNAATRAAVAHRPLPPGAPAAIANEVAAQRATSRLVLARSLIQFKQDATDTDNVPLLQRVERFSATVRQLQIAIQDQNIAAVPELTTQIDNEFAPLTQDIRESSRDYAENASHAQTLALIGRLIVFLSTGAIIAAMYWRYHAIQRRVEVAAAEQEVLRRSEARFRPLVQSSADIITVINADYVITYTSPAIERIAGVKAEAVVGQHVSGFVAERDRVAFEAFLDTAKRRPGEIVTDELEFTLADQPRTLELVCTNRLADPDVNGLVLNVRDVTERKQLEQQLRFQAFHDGLTGLANGKLFGERLEQALERTAKSGRGQVSVIFMDLDRFKEVNDEFGHQAGDELLSEVGVRLGASIRSSDTAARLGGDEFAILIDDVNGASKASDVADRVFASMALPFMVGGREVTVSASIGVIVAEPETMSAGDVLRNADLAMYDAKHHGRNRVHHFQPAMLLALADLDAMAERERRSAAA